MGDRISRYQNQKLVGAFNVFAVAWMFKKGICLPDLSKNYSLARIILNKKSGCSNGCPESMLINRAYCHLKSSLRRGGVQKLIGTIVLVCLIQSNQLAFATLNPDVNILVLLSFDISHGQNLIWLGSTRLSIGIIQTSIITLKLWMQYDLVNP